MNIMNHLCKQLWCQLSEVSKQFHLPFNSVDDKQPNRRKGKNHSYGSNLFVFFVWSILFEITDGNIYIGYQRLPKNVSTCFWKGNIK